jgi:hypothetical protein
MARRENSSKLQMVAISVIPQRFKPGTQDIDLTNVVGVAIEIDPASGGFNFQGLLQGTVTFAETGMEKDARVSGKFTAQIMMFSGIE